MFDFLKASTTDILNLFKSIDSEQKYDDTLSSLVSQLFEGFYNPELSAQDKLNIIDKIKDINSLVGYLHTIFSPHHKLKNKFREGLKALNKLAYCTSTKELRQVAKDDHEKQTFKQGLTGYLKLKAILPDEPYFFFDHLSEINFIVRKAANYIVNNFKKLKNNFCKYFSLSNKQKPELILKYMKSIQEGSVIMNTSKCVMTFIEDLLVLGVPELFFDNINIIINEDSINLELLMEKESTFSFNEVEKIAYTARVRTPKKSVAGNKSIICSAWANIRKLVELKERNYEDYKFELKENFTFYKSQLTGCYNPT